MFEEQYLSNQSELGHTILRVWKPYMRAFSYTKFCVTIPSIRWVTGKTSPDWENTVKYRIPALQGALHPEILHVTWNPFDIMAVDMSGAIIPKDISICSVVEEIARQIDHFTRELARLSVSSVTLKSPLLSNQDDFCHDIWRVWKPYSQAFICCTICVDNHSGCWEK